MCEQNLPFLCSNHSLSFQNYCHKLQHTVLALHCNGPFTVYGQMSIPVIVKDNDR